MTPLSADRLSLMTMPMALDVARHRLSFDAICAMARRHGIRRLDLLDLEITLYGRRRLESALARHGMSVSSLVASVPFLVGSPRRIERRLRSIVRTAAAVGAPRVMVVPGDLVTAARKVERMSGSGKTDLYVSGMGLAVDLAAARGIEVLFEDTPSVESGLSTAAQCGAVLDRVAGLGLVLDTANMLAGGDEPLAFADRLAGRASYVQLKDASIGGEKGDRMHDGRRMRTSVWGEGVVPLAAMAERLERAGYDGVVSIEYCAPDGPRNLAAHERQLERFLAHPVVGAC